MPNTDVNDARKESVGDRHHGVLASASREAGVESNTRLCQGATLKFSALEYESRPQKYEIVKVLDWYYSVVVQGLCTADGPPASFHDQPYQPWPLSQEI